MSCNETVDAKQMDMMMESAAFTFRQLMGMAVTIDLCPSCALYHLTATFVKTFNDNAGGFEEAEIVKIVMQGTAAALNLDMEVLAVPDKGKMI